MPEPPAEAVTRLGELWLLGRHRLLCGDAADPAAYALLLGGTPADLLLTDPPYNVAYAGKTAAAMTIANDDLDAEAYRAFLARCLAAAIAVVKPGGGFYVLHADLHGLPVRLACLDAGLAVRQCLVWAKSAFTLSRQDYHWRHEPCLYGWKDVAAHQWLCDRSQSTVLEFDRPAKNGEHPTMKPVALFGYLTRNSCPACRTTCSRPSAAPVAAGVTEEVLEAELTPPAGAERVFAVWTRGPQELDPAALRGLADADGAGPSRAYRTTRDLQAIRRSVASVPDAERAVAVLELDHRPA